MNDLRSWMRLCETAAAGETIEWTKPYASETTAVWIDVAALDASWRLDRGVYIGPNGTGGAIKNRYARFGDWLASRREPVEMPMVSFNEWRHCVSFGNGRHRFAWLRDHGVTALPVCVPDEQADLIRTRFGTTERVSILPQGTDTLREAVEGLTAEPFEHTDPISRQRAISYHIIRAGETVGMVSSRYATTPDEAVQAYLSREQWKADRQHPVAEPVRKAPKRVRPPRADVRVWIVPPVVRQAIRDGDDAPDAFLYHVTSWPRARQIIRTGLRVNAAPMFTNYGHTTRDRIFLTERDGVLFWEGRVAAHLQHEFDDPPRVAVLRVRRDDVADLLQPDVIGTADARAAAYFITASFS